MLKKLRKWFYTTFLGDLYVEFLLWHDRVTSRDKNFTYIPVNQIIRKARSLAYEEGIGTLKQHVNSLVRAKSKDEYNAALKNIEDMMAIAGTKNAEKEKIRQALYSAYVFKDKDIKNDTDMVKMIDKRIEDHKELWSHKEKRDLTRKLRNAKKNNDSELVSQLEKEWYAKYGR